MARACWAHPAPGGPGRRLEILERAAVLLARGHLADAERFDVVPELLPAGNQTLGPELVPADRPADVHDVVWGVGRDADEGQFGVRGCQPDRERRVRAVAEVPGHRFGQYIPVPFGREIDERRLRYAAGPLAGAAQGVLPAGEVGVEDHDPDALAGLPSGVEPVEPGLLQRVFVDLLRRQGEFWSLIDGGFLFLFLRLVLFLVLGHGFLGRGRGVGGDRARQPRRPHRDHIRQGRESLRLPPLGDAHRDDRADRPLIVAPAR